MCLYKGQIVNIFQSRRPFGLYGNFSSPHFTSDTGEVSLTLPLTQLRSAAFPSDMVRSVNPFSDVGEVS